ncbi:MAG: hypothetical protein Tsb0015_03620 [Simkaniaceae bacterium]
MIDPIRLEEIYRNFVQDFPSNLPDGIIKVDLALLNQMGLLRQEEFDENNASEEFPHYFHVLETEDKVTLFNHQFAVWIVPQLVENIPTTITLIALISGKKPQLEIVFSTSGVYNTPKYVLKVLRYFLSEVVDTEEVISSIGNN